ncbi:unnamed protein product, partial [marine sediment metagenome]
AGPVPESELDIVDTGRVTTAAAVGTNILNDNTKIWAANVHKNRLVRIINGPGVGQTFVIDSNIASTLVIKGTWLTALTLSSQYVILAGVRYSGQVYENENTATDDNARRFETSSKKLRDVIIQVTTNDQLFGNATNQRYKVTAESTIGITQIDISTLYFKNAAAGQNGTVNILGVED